MDASTTLAFAAETVNNIEITCAIFFAIFAITILLVVAALKN